MDIRTIIDTIVSAFTRAFQFIVEHPLYIVLIFGAIIAYAIASHLRFRYKGYQPQEGKMCILTVMGKERSLDYLKSFTHMTPEQISIINYLRKNETAPLGALAKRFGKENVEILIRRQYIVVT